MGPPGPFPTCRDALQYLYSLTDYERMTAPQARATSLFGLERVEALLEFLGRPERRLRIVHIAGTKGKGSTAAFTAAILRCTGARVGLYTSPHVECVRERITVDGQWIPEERLAGHIRRLHPHLEDRRAGGPTHTPTFFEAFTAIALLDFVAQQVDYAVLEVGLGGRLDATNVATPMACGITHVSFDHTDKLGNTLAAIAGEKAGILKPAVPAVVAPQEPEALEAIEARAAELACPLELVGRDLTVARQRGHLDIVTPRRCYTRLRPALVGEHQHLNAAVAVALAEHATQATGGALPDDAVRRGLATATCRARIETVAERPTVVVDGAHNVASIRALAATLDTSFRFRRLLLVVGIADDKDIEGMLRLLAPRASAIILTRADCPRACRPEALLARLRTVSTVPAVVCDRPADALAEARARAEADDLICVTGSFYVAGEVLASLASAPPAS